MTSLVSLGYTLYKSKNRGFSIAFFFAVLELTFFIELGLVILTDAYSYFPKIAKDPFMENIFGNYFSQLSLCATALLTAELGLGFPWYLGFAAGYYLIEELFLKLGIYTHHWYRTWFTPAGFIPLVWLFKKWYYKVLYSPPAKNFSYYLALFLAAHGAFFVFNGSFIFHLLLKKYPLHLIPKYLGNQGIGLFLDINSTILISIFLYKWRTNWQWKVLSFAGLFGVRYLLYKTGVIYFKASWFLIITFLDLFESYFLVAVMDYLLRKNKAVNHFKQK